MKSLEFNLIEEFGTSTFSESDPEFKSLGWSGGVEDDRDWRAEDFLGIDRDSGRQLWANPIRLNQGNEGACFPADTLVRMADGSHKPIQDVRLLDWVVTAEGNTGRILKLFAREYSGNLATIRLRGHSHLKCTANHKILTKRGYVPAEELETGDLVALTKHRNTPTLALKPYELVSLSESKGIKRGLRDSGGIIVEIDIPTETIPLTKEFGRLVGLYLAEGSTTPNKVQWSFGAHEADTLVPETVELIEKTLGQKARVQERKANNVFNVIVYGKVWRLLFERLFGRGSANKQLPSRLASGPSDYLEAILWGWIDGDGHRRRSSAAGVTVSHALALDMYRIAQDAGLRPAIRMSKPSLNRHAKTRKDRWEVEIALGGGKDAAGHGAGLPEQTERHVYRKVKEVELTPWRGIVYNQHVEGDESYVAEGVAVKNCVGFGHTGVSNAQPAKSEFGNVRGFEVYNLAKENFDPWPGSNYEGTTVRAGAKAQVYLGEYEGYAFTQDVNVLALWILNHGTAAIGVDWLTGMDRVDSEGFIHATGSVRGGHCVNVDGVTWDYEENPWGVNYFRFPNSWGRSWGFNGRGRISAEDLQMLFNRGGTACMPVEIPNA